MVSVIVVSGGIKEYLRPCINSINSQTYSPGEIIVIDNSPSRVTGQELQGLGTNIQLFSSPESLFYCGALNIGIKMSKADFILCLNDDVTLDKRFLEEALRGFRVDNKIGMVSGKILRSDKETIDTTGLSLSLFRTAKERGYGLKDRGQFEKEGYIFGVNGAVAFYRRELLEDTKIDSYYFDSGFHIFYEDLDIAWRSQNRGWRAYYTPEAIAYHIRGGTVRLAQGIDKSPARNYISNELHLDLIKNRYLTIIRNESCKGLILHLPFIIFYEVLLWAYLFIFKPGLVKKFILSSNCLKSAFKKRIGFGL